MSAPTGSPASASPLPELRQDVVLTLPQQEQYRARVTRVTPDEIVVVLMTDARDPLSPGDVAPMAIEYPGPRGLVRFEGSGTVATSDLIRFKLDGAVDVVQRRDFVRVRVVRPLSIAPLRADGSPGEWVDALTVNLSGNGLLTAGPETLSVDQAVAFRIEIADGEAPVEGRGRVARIGDAGQRGMAIEQLDGDGRRRLVRFIFECERIARQRTRDGEL